jgi:hypothetical protein
MQILRFFGGAGVLYEASRSCCGKEAQHALYEINFFFGCPVCHEFAWLRYQYLDREHGIIYGLQLVQEP